MSTFEQVHAGDTVLGHDGEVWGVKAIDHVPYLAVTLIKYGQQVTGYPPAGTPVTVVAPADLSAEFWAAQVLIDAGFDVELIAERV
jgi:hypothetical protein